MGKIKVVHILPNLNTGGAQVFTTNLLKAIDPRQYDCVLITLSTPEADNKLFQDLKKSAIKHYSLGKKLGFSVKTTFRLRLLLQSLKPDILHTHMHTLKYAYFSHFGLQPPPWVHTVHTLAESELLYLERRIASHLFRKEIVLPIAVSQNVAQSIESIYHIPGIKVIYNRIPFYKRENKAKSYYRKRLSLPVRGILAINVARLAPAKNHMMLLEAFRKISAKYSQINLILVGDGPMRRMLENQAKALDIGTKVLFRGMVIEPEPFLRAADIFVSSSDREGLPVSLLEAMREGLPVVATRAGGVPEVVDDSVNGYLVEIGDTKGLTRALERLMNASKRLNFGENAKRKISAVFDIKISALEYEKIYEKELGKN